jgi:hypothetical protein
MVTAPVPPVLPPPVMGPYSPMGGPGFFPYNPYGYGPDPYGGYLNGAASVITAQGQYLINNQQAYLLREKVRSAQIENKRKTFDEWLYERANLPSLNEQREKAREEEIRRSLNTAPLTEVWSGKSLNDILANIQNLRNKGYEGPNVSLSTDLLRQINVTTGAAGSGNPGLLKDVGNLSWPIGLQGLSGSADLRKQIDTLLLQATKQAAAGRVDAGTMNELDRAISKMRTDLVSQVGNFGFQSYTESKRFLRELDDAVSLLKRPDASQFLDGKFSAQGGNVRELVEYMSANGLRFAPAVSGQEGAYSALQNALVQYDVGASVNLSTTADPRGSALFPRTINPNPR